MSVGSRDLSPNIVVVRKDFTPKIVSRDHMNTVARRGFLGSENKRERKAGVGCEGDRGKCITHHISQRPLDWRSPPHRHKVMQR